jgi:trimethylamine--corrinoid protein Co-methyltransferase
LANLRLQVLTEQERDQIHNQSLSILANTGVRVDSARGREILKNAGARVDDITHVVRFPTSLVEEALRLAPKKIICGGRRPGWRMSLNDGMCTLCADGEAIAVVDAFTGERRESTYQDWLKATLLIDALDDVSVYWAMVKETKPPKDMGEVVTYWEHVFTYFTKHVQESTHNLAQTRWMLEVMQVFFGDRNTISQLRPLSFLLCPFSPLVIEATYTDAYLETIGWNIPVAVMPMPVMGSTSPGSLISTIVQGNCEVLAMLCLIQAATPGTLFIYAPALAVMEPHTGRYTGGAVEHALLGAACTEMGRYYNLPVEASAGGTEAHHPGIQASYEISLNWLLPVLSWPDILVGPGLLDGSKVLSFEQFILDVEIYRRSCRIYQGINTDEKMWLGKEISEVSPGGNFLAHLTTRNGIRNHEWYFPTFGYHDAYEKWLSAGKPEILDEIRSYIEQILRRRVAMPLDNEMIKELDILRAKAKAE